VRHEADLARGHCFFRRCRSHAVSPHQHGLRRAKRGPRLSAYHGESDGTSFESVRHHSWAGSALGR
jgi:hypothetical protein